MASNNLLIERLERTTISSEASVVSAVIDDVRRACTKRGRIVNDAVVAYMVKATLLNPRHGFNTTSGGSVALQRTELDRLVQVTSECVVHASIYRLNAVKMQILMDEHFMPRDKIVRKNIDLIERRLQQIVRDICSVSIVTADRLEDLFRKLVSYILLRTNLGSVTDLRVIEDCSAALNSILPKHDLPLFVKLTKREKAGQLSETAYLVTGVRLFNKDAGRGGEGIEDIPLILSQSLPILVQDVMQDAAKHKNIAENLAKIVIMMEEQQKFASLQPLKSDMSDAIITCWQFVFYCDDVLRQLHDCHEKVQIAKKELVKCLDTLHTIVSSKNVIPAADVYPWFVYLAKLWFSFQDETLVCGLMKSCHESLLQLCDEVQHLILHPELTSVMTQVSGAPLDPTLDNGASQPSTNFAPLEEWRLNKLYESAAAADISKNNKSISTPSPSNVPASPENSNSTAATSVGGENSNNTTRVKKFSVLHRAATSNFMQLQPSFVGFCPVAMVIHDGLLVRGNADLGYVRYEDKLCAFVSRQHAHAFALKPEHFVAQMMQFAYEKPELIHLLRLYSLRRQQAELGSGGVDNLQPMPLAEPVTMNDAGAQTDVHPIATHIDRNYQWNEWDMRKKALFLANVRSKKTTASQTLHSNFKRECASQVYEQRMKAAQTRQMTPTNVPPPKRYVQGLQGGNRAFQPIAARNIVLTVPLGDWPY